MQNKRVVITGIGVVSSIGIGKDAFWQSLQDGKSGIKPVTLFDVSNLSVREAGEISDFNGKDHFSSKSLIHSDRAGQLLLTAAQSALNDARYVISEKNTYESGVSIGATFSALSCSSQFDREALSDEPRFANPALFPNTVMNAAASRISIHFKIKGMNTTISTGICAGLDAIDYAVKAIRYRGKKMIVAGGVEDLSEALFLGFYRAGLLSGITNGKVVSCPFDSKRDGIALSEGAGVVILEDMESAQKRGAKIYGEILAIASAYAPLPRNQRRSMSDGMIDAMGGTLRLAGIQPKDIDYIFANANGSIEGDAEEEKAIRAVFSNEKKMPLIGSIKAIIGESLSAGGVLSLIAGAGAIENNFSPARINCQNVGSGQPPSDFQNSKSGGKSIQTALVNAFCFSGLSTSAIIKRHSA